MPRGVRITREEIVRGAIELVREKGAEALNARALAAVLDCSTQPIFSNFATMEELSEATLEGAYALYYDFLEKEAQRGDHPRYKSFGMAYIRFAKEERELFKLLFMRDRRGEEISSAPDFDASVEMIMEANGVDRETARIMHMEMWSFVHGLATMQATSFLELDAETISRMTSDAYQGLRARHLVKE